MNRSRRLLRCATFVVLALAFSFTPASGQVATQPAPSAVNADARATQTLVDSSIPDDAAVNKMLEVYSPKIRGLNDIIGKLKGDLRKGGVGAGSLGNFVTNGLKVEAERHLGKPVALAITNSGGLRKNTISEGNLRLQDMFELLPFENALMAFDLTGAQVIDLLKGLTRRGDAQSGARIKYKLNDKRPQLETVQLLVNGKETRIDPEAVYTVISTDYLLRVSGGDYSAILSSARNIRPLRLTMRDALTQYVKAETAAGREIQSTLDGRFVFDGPEEERPE